MLSKVRIITVNPARNRMKLSMLPLEESLLRAARLSWKRCLWGVDSAVTISAGFRITNYGRFRVMFACLDTRHATGSDYDYCGLCRYPHPTSRARIKGSKLLLLLLDFCCLSHVGGMVTEPAFSRRRALKELCIDPGCLLLPRLACVYGSRVEGLGPSAAIWASWAPVIWVLGLSSLDMLWKGPLHDGAGDFCQTCFSLEETPAQRTGGRQEPHPFRETTPLPQFAEGPYICIQVLNYSL